MVGIGLRRDIVNDILHSKVLNPDFLEVAPENWMGVGGNWKKDLDRAAADFPLSCHGLSLSLGSPEDLDADFLSRLKSFLDTYQVQIYSEHLSYTKSQNAHLYDLLPLPFRKDAVMHVASRIRQVQDILGRSIAIENVSYYTPVAPQMSEAEFIGAILEEADSQLLLDVNNVYVNAFNHGYDAREFIASLPLDRVAYIHMAGHERVEPDLIIDTHGEAIIDPVYELFEWTISRMSPVPVLLERDYNFEDLEQIGEEIEKLKNITQKYWRNKHVPAQGN